MDEENHEEYIQDNQNYENNENEISQYDEKLNLKVKVKVEDIDDDFIQYDTLIKRHISLLIDEYKDDNFFCKKLYTYVKHAERHILSLKKVQEVREERRLNLEQLKDTFMDDFFNIYNCFYYLKDTDMFIMNVNYENSFSNYISLYNEYPTYINDLNTSETNSISSSNSYIQISGDYRQISENIIGTKIHKLFVNYPDLYPWKQKTRIEIISKIKKNNFLHVIPETDTIQRVLDIFTSCITTNKYTAKFLLCILGDAILKKHIDSIYLIDSGMNIFLQELQIKINNFIYGNILSNFKIKYHNQDYNKLYILQSNTNINKHFLWNKLIINHLFDIIAVACHYSTRYGKATTYILNGCNCEDTKQYVLYLKYHTKQQIIQDFNQEFLEQNEDMCIDEKEMHYLFKSYLETIELPKIMFYQDVTNELSKLYTVGINSNNHNTFFGVTSKKLSSIQMFLNFFRSSFEHIPEFGENIEYDTGSPKTNLHFRVHYEISEIQDLYKLWKQQNSIHSNTNQLKDKQIINILKHFFDIHFEKDKYMYNYISSLWNKQTDIQTFLLNCQNTIQNGEKQDHLEKNDTYSNEVQEQDFYDEMEHENDTSINVLYKHPFHSYQTYCEWCKKHSKLVVSKFYYDHIYQTLERNM